MPDVLEEIARQFPGWTTATILIRDAAGLPVGAGYVERDGDTAIVTVSAWPEGVSLLRSR